MNSEKQRSICFFYVFLFNEVFLVITFKKKKAEMKHSINKGLKKRIEITTSVKDSARSYGSGLVDVFASPAMIALMENTALQTVSAELEEGYNTVGTAVNVKHIKATPIGMKVHCVAELIEVDGSKLRFQVEAFDEDGKIGFGTHDRYIINMASFLQNLQKTQS